MGGSEWALFSFGFDSFAIGCTAITLFAAVWSLASIREGRVPDRLLAVVLVLFGLNILHPLLPFDASEFPALEPLQFILLVSLLWYVRSLNQTRWWGSELFLLLLPPLFIVLRLVYAPPFLSLIFWLTLVLCAVVLLVPLSFILRQHRTALMSQYSNLKGVDPGWLTGFLRMLWVLFGLYALCVGFLLHAPLDFPVRRILSAAMGVLGVYVAWKVLQRKARSVGDIAEADGEPFLAIRTEEQEHNARRLEAVLTEHKLYRNPELTLDDLALAAGLGRHDTSAALNRGLGCSFYDLINRYRIEEFQRLAGDPRRADEKILSLAFEAGFNSKPTFNLVFKKATGQTPSEFRHRVTIVS